MAEPMLRLTDLTISFGDLICVRDVSLDVTAGRIHGLLGPNGAGKTSLLRAALGLLVPASGHIEIDGALLVPGAALPAAAAGFVDLPRFWPALTASETLAELAELDGSMVPPDIADVLKRVGLAEAADRRVGEFSLGMRQRLAIAAALLRSPRLLILDEPTGGLDPHGIADLHALLTSLASDGCAILLSSHDLTEVASLCDDLTVVSHGSVVFSGTMAEARAAAPAASWVLRTTDNPTAVRTLAGRPGVQVTEHLDTVVISGEQRFVDGAVAALAVNVSAGGPALRELTVERPPLAALFDALTSIDAPPQAEPVQVVRPADPPPAPRPPAWSGVVAVARHEIRRVLSERGTRIVLAVLALAPVLFAIALAVQDSLPKDTLFGRQLHTSPAALPFVVLGFAASWGLPALGGLVAGDVFSMEDLHGTWPLLLTRGRSRSEIYLGKLLAAAAAAVVAVVTLGLFSIAAGVLAGRGHGLIGATGQTLHGSAVGLAALAWLSTIPQVLAFAAIGAALSVRSRRGWIGVGGPVLIGLVMLLLSQLDAGPVVRRALLTSGMLAWHGFVQSPPTTTPFLVALLVAAAWTAAALTSGWRAFAATGPGARRTPWQAPTTVATAALVAAALAAMTTIGGGSLSNTRLAAALSRSYDARYLLQQQVTELAGIANVAVHSHTLCTRANGSLSGPGDDWVCLVSWLSPTQVTFTARYDVTLRADGCFVAEGAASMVGGMTLRTSTGAAVDNPLYAFDGCLPLT